MNRLSLQPNKQHQKMAICYKELDSIKDIFNEKEKELSVAMAKVDALTRQLDELKNGNIINSYSISTKNSNFTNSIASNCQISNSNYNLELEKLKQELLYRNKLNEKLEEEMILKQKKIDQRKVELNNIDQRINELQSRLSRKRTLNQQLNAQIKSHLLKTENNQSKTFNDNLNNENDVPNCVSILKANLRRSIGAGQPYKFTHLKPLNAFEPLKRQPKSEVILNTNSTSDKKSIELNLLSSQHQNESEIIDSFEPKIATLQNQNCLTTISDSSNYNSKNKNIFEVNDYKSECNSNYDKKLFCNDYAKDVTKVSNKNQNFYNQKPQLSNEMSKNNQNKQLLDDFKYKDDNYKENSQSLPNHRLNAINNTAKYLIVDRKNDQREIISDYEKTNVLKKQISSPVISTTSSNTENDFVSSFSSPNLNSTFNSNHQNKVSINDSNYRFSKNDKSRDEHGIEKGHVLKSVQQLQQNFEKKNQNSNNLNNVNNNLEANNDQNKLNFNDSVKLIKQSEKSNKLQVESNLSTSKPELNNHINESFNYGSIIQNSYKNNTDSESDLSSETSTSVNYKIPKSSSLKNFVEKNNELNNENNDKVLKVKDNFKKSVDNSDWLRKRRPLVADIDLEEQFEKINSSYNQDLDMSETQKNVNENMNNLSLKTDKDSYFDNLCNSSIKNLNGDDFISSNSSSGHSPTSLEDLSSNKMEFRNVIRNIMCKNLGSSSDKSSTMSEEETDEDDENSVECKAVINDKKTIKSLSNKNDIQDDVNKTKDNQKCNLKSNIHMSLNLSIDQSDESTGEKENSEMSINDNSQNEDHLDNCLNLEENISKTNGLKDQDSGHEVLKRTKSNLKKHFGKNKRRVSFDPLALFLDAALEGELELVKKTATQVSNPSASSEGITALHNAICAGHFDIVKFLVEIGCDVNAQDHDGWTPLHCAASCNNLPMVKYLVEHGACIFAVTWNDHETPAQKCEEMEDGYHGCSQYLYSMQEKLGDVDGNPVYAVYDYNAQQADELSFKSGDLIKILDKSDENESEWWWASIDHKTGYVPRNLLSIYPRVIPKPKETM